MLKQQKIEQAKQVALQIYQIDSVDVENQAVLASVLTANNELDAAQKLCESALQARPNYPEVFAVLGQISWKLGDKKSALQLFEKALSIKPHFTHLSPSIAAFHNENKNLPAAITTLKNALEVEPENVEMRVSLGEFLRQNYQPAEAISVLEKVLQLSPKNAGAWTNLGTVFQQTGEIEKAKLAYEKALAINPNQAELLNNFSDIVKDENDLETALEYIEKALTIEPKRAIFMVNKAAILNNLGRFEDAEKVVLHALEIEPTSDHAHCVLGSIYQNKNRLHDANSSYLKALEIKPDLEKAALALATNYYLLLDYSATHEFFKRALPLLHRPKLKEFKGNKICVSYIGRLLDWWENENRDLNFNEQEHDLPILAVIGESHSLAAHQTNLMQHRCRANWVGGIKMWHLAQTKSHPMKLRIMQILHELPADKPIMFCIGEIDCRLDEGIWSAAKKQAKNYQQIAEKTVVDYIGWLESALQNAPRRNVIIQGVCAPNYQLDEENNSNEEIAQFLEMIAFVNRKLMLCALEKGWQFLDVYSATALENGRSNQQWHLDGHHLKPSFYAQADQWLKFF